MKTTIGILGGMGPRATVRFEQLLLERLAGTDQDIPAIITINDGSIPDRSKYLLGTGTDPLPQLQRHAATLERMGTQVIALPCNSACAPKILQRLQAATATPIIDLPEVVVATVAQECTRVCLLATEGLVASGRYQQLCAVSGVDCEAPSPRDQRLVGTVIRAVKANDLATARLAAAQLKAKLQTTDCQAVILGCTELPGVSRFLVPPGLMAINTLEVLAEEVVAYTKQNSREVAAYDAGQIYA